jgi:N-methylhydantoinase A
MAPLTGVDWAEISAMIAAMTAQGRDLVRHAGVEAAEITTTIAIMMRYVGQGYEVEVPVQGAWITDGDGEAIASSFADSYRRRFGRIEAMPVETISWRVVTSGPRPPLDETLRTDALAGADNAARGSRPVWFGLDSSFINTAVFDRNALMPGSRIDGPAILEEVESTLVLPPDFGGEVDAGLNFIATRQSERRS